MARVALSYGLGILHLGGNGWNLLGLITLIGAIALLVKKSGSTKIRFQITDDFPPRFCVLFA